MGRRLRSYDDLEGGNASFLDAWKEQGFLKTWLHREPPWERQLHNFWFMAEDEEKGVKKLKIRWMPFVCWEPDEFLKQLRIAKARKEPEPIPALCPQCRMVSHLERREDLANDEVIFYFEAGRERRVVVKIDAIGKGDTADSFMTDLTAKTDYVIPVIPVDNPVGVFLTNEKWSLGQALIARIKTDRKLLGTDVGDPQKTPIAYTFEFDKAQGKYSVNRFPEAELTAEIQALWEGTCPDAGRFIEPSDPKKLLEWMQKSAKVELPFEAIFEPVLEEVARQEKEKAQVQAAAVAAANTAPTAPKGNGAHPAQKSESATAPSKPASAPTRPVRKTAAKPEPKPEPEAPEVPVPLCGGCGAEWPEDVPQCPSCGAEPEQEAPAAPPPAVPPKAAQAATPPAGQKRRIPF